MNTGSICYNNAVCNAANNSICLSNVCATGSFSYNSGRLRKEWVLTRLLIISMINFQFKGFGTCSDGQIFTGNACYGNKNYNKSIVSNTSAFKS